MAQLKQGDHVVSVRDCYSWTHTLFAQYLPRFGVETTFVDGRAISDFTEAVRGNTRIIYLESPTTFTFNLQDLKAICDFAKSRHITTIIDNSWATPLFQTPIDFGTDIVVSSASKYIGGHSDVVGGYLVCREKEMFDHIFDTEFMNIGAVPGPFESWLCIRGLRTLPVRIEGHMKSAFAVVDFLSSHPKIDYVRYPYHPSHPQYALAKEQMRGGTGLFSFRINTTSVDKIRTFTDALTIFRKGVSWGGYESLIAPCALDLSLDGQEKAGVVRIHVGLEGEEEIIRDLERALKLI
jgi:cystathionine beta-lyase/cystathionine gamma-synthase